MELSPTAARAALSLAESAKGPVAAILCEDETQVAGTVAHHLARGFARIILFARPDLDLPDLPEGIARVDCDAPAPGALAAVINTLAKATPGQWFYAGFNAEYLFHPFCGARSVKEFLTHVAEERRPAVMGIVTDLYAADLGAHPDAVDPETAHLDAAGFYAEDLPEAPPDEAGHPQIGIYGGLRWRFEQHVAPNRRRINRVALFQARPGLVMGPERLFNLPQYNAISAPWHHSATCAIASFRAAKALRRNPGSREAIQDFRWSRSQPFDWTDQQLMDLGFMEPGQWF